jgi:uncharacterized protein (TIGR00369 family)
MTDRDARADMLDLGYLPGGEQAGLEQMRAFARSAKAPSMRHTFGIKLPEIQPGYVVCEAEPSLAARNSMGGTHGGYAAVLLDSACGNAVHTLLTPGQTYATVEIKISYVRPVRIGDGRVRSIGRVIAMGKRIAFAEGQLLDGRGKLLASASATFVILDGRTAGLSAQKLTNSSIPTRPRRD